MICLFFFVSDSIIRAFVFMSKTLCYYFYCCSPDLVDFDIPSLELGKGFFYVFDWNVFFRWFFFQFNGGIISPWASIISSVSFQISSMDSSAAVCGSIIAAWYTLSRFPLAIASTVSC